MPMSFVSVSYPSAVSMTETCRTAQLVVPPFDIVVSTKDLLSFHVSQGILP